MSTASVVVLCFVPLIIAALDYAETLFGSARAGWISSFPVVGGPALLILTLEHGSVFGADAARNALLGVAGWAAFVLCYRFDIRLRSKKVVPSALVIAVSLILWAGCGWILTSGRLPAIWPLLMLSYVTTLGIAFGSVNVARGVPSRSFLMARVSLATTFVIATLVASYVGGERLSGVLTTFPIVSSALMIPVFVRGAREQSAQIVAGMLTAGPALATFMLSVSFLLASHGGVLLSFSLSLLVALVVHLAMWRLVSHRADAKVGLCSGRDLQ